MERLRAGETRRASGWWVGQGAIGGLLGGAAFLAFEIAVAATTMGASWALLPLRMMAGILLGPGIVDAASPALPAVLGGLLVHRPRPRVRAVPRQLSGSRGDAAADR